MSTDDTGPMPRIGRDGVGTCDDLCPQHDGKRCRILGVRAPEGRVCPPWAERLLNEIRECITDIAAGVPVNLVADRLRTAIGEREVPDAG